MPGSRFREALPNHLAFESDIPAKAWLPMEVALPLKAWGTRRWRFAAACKRPLVRSITVPGPTHGEALQRTRVRIGVNPDGYVASITLPGRLAKLHAAGGRSARTGSASRHSV